MGDESASSCSRRTFSSAVQAIGEGGKVAQRLNKGHVLIVLNGADAVQPRAPNLDLFEEPLIASGWRPSQ